MSAELVRRYLMEHGVGYETHAHSIAYTTSETAQADHVSSKEMAKVVLLMADDRLVMTVLPGHEMVDVAKAKVVLGAGDVRLAEEEEFGPSFQDCETGAEPPFGGLYGVPMLVDDGLDSSTITFKAGSHDETITMELGNYLELTNPQRADLTLAQ